LIHETSTFGIVTTGLTNKIDDCFRVKFTSSVQRFLS